MPIEVHIDAPKLGSNWKICRTCPGCSPKKDCIPARRLNQRIDVVTKHLDSISLTSFKRPKGKKINISGGKSPVPLSMKMAYSDSDAQKIDFRKVPRTCPNNFHIKLGPQF